MSEVTATAHLVCEGKAKVLLPPNVFYNPVQEFNRDLTIAVISQMSAEQWNRKKTDDDSKKSCKTLKSEKSESDGIATLCANVEVTSEREDIKDFVAENFPIESGEVPVVCDVSASSISNVSKENSANDTKTKAEADISMGTGKPYTDGIRILEGLAASGLRSVRFALEIPGVREIIANDFDQVAFDYIKQNAKRNSVEEIVTPSYMDAAMLMYQSRRISEQFDVIDLDPYGSPAIFLDAAVQSVRDGGLLCVTCTDMAVLCGNATETCHAKYGSTSLKSRLCHEMALRILLRSLESHANRYSRYIVPTLSISVDFYCRVFVRIFTGQKRVKDSATKLSMVYQCNGCESYALQPLVTKTATHNNNFKYTVSTGPPVGSRCAQCNGRFNVGGPIWSAPIHDRGFVEQVIASVESGISRFGTRQRILGVLNVVCEELENIPLYYDVDHLCRVLHCTAIGFLPIRSALLHRGFEVSLSHASKKSLKTNAPSEVIWDVLRCWVKKNPVGADRLQTGSTAETILSREPSFEADFSTHPDANPASRRKGLVRWQLNPEKDWGPKPRAARSRRAVEERKQAQDAKCQKLKAKRKAINEEDLRTTVRLYPCKKFRKGLCDLGTKCLYSHEVDTENPDDELACNSEETSPRDSHDKVLLEAMTTEKDSTDD